MTSEKTIVMRPPTEIVSFEELKFQTQRLNEFYKNLMQEGTDFGIIPGTPKPSLLKPGAELLRLWAGLSPTFSIDSKGTDLIVGIFNYEIKCSLYNKEGRLIGEGVGSCNSLESKYRYRWLWSSELPNDFDKDKATTRWVQGKGEGKVPQYRVDNENPQDLANTILKMAKKRAFIDSILTVTGASRIFTQDIEDMDISAAKVEKETQPAQEHWCPVHNVAFQLKKGKDGSSWYSHKIEGGLGTSAWCNESQLKKQDNPTEPSQDALGEQGGQGKPKEIETPKPPKITAPVKGEETELPKPKRDPVTIKTIEQLAKALKEDFGLSYQAQWAELNITSWSQLAITPVEAYQQVAATRQ